MVYGYHVIIGAYGFWLPNDPRGSWSVFVGSWDLFRFGPANPTEDTRSTAHLVHDVQRRLAAKKVLKFPAVQFTGMQALAISHGFANYVERSGLPIWACAILPEHVHLVVARFRLDIEQIIIQLKGEATQQLIKENLHPFGDRLDHHGRPPKCWARGEWSVFLENAEDIQRSITYVEQNPVKEGKKPQRWPFVCPYDPTRFV